VDLVARFPGHRTRSHHASRWLQRPVGRAGRVPRRPARELPLAVPRNTAAPLAGWRSVLTVPSTARASCRPRAANPERSCGGPRRPFPWAVAGLPCVRLRTQRAVCRSRAADATRECTCVRARAAARCTRVVRAGAR
jgi:hypothetical protein